MAGKKTGRSSGDREISLRIDGQQVELNGFVQDAFQETIIGLVRSLGDENEKGSIEVRIAGDDSRDNPEIINAGMTQE